MECPEALFAAAAGCGGLAKPSVIHMDAVAAFEAEIRLSGQSTPGAVVEDDAFACSAGQNVLFPAETYQSARPST